MKKAIFILMLFTLVSCSNPVSPEPEQEFVILKGQTVLIYGNPLGEFLYITHRGASGIVEGLLLTYTHSKGSTMAIWIPDVKIRGFLISLPDGKRIVLYQVAGKCDENKLTITWRYYEDNVRPYSGIVHPVGLDSCNNFNLEGLWKQ